MSPRSVTAWTALAFLAGLLVMILPAVAPRNGPQPLGRPAVEEALVENDGDGVASVEVQLFDSSNARLEDVTVQVLPGGIRAVSFGHLAEDMYRVDVAVTAGGAQGRGSTTVSFHPGQCGGRDVVVNVVFRATSQGSITMTGRTVGCR